MTNKIAVLRDNFILIQKKKEKKSTTIAQAAEELKECKLPRFKVLHMIGFCTLLKKSTTPPLRQIQLLCTLFIMPL